MFCFWEKSRFYCGETLPWATPHEPISELESAPGSPGSVFCGLHAIVGSRRKLVLEGSKLSKDRRRGKPCPLGEWVGMNEGQIEEGVGSLGEQAKTKTIPEVETPEEQEREEPEDWCHFWILIQKHAGSSWPSKPDIKWTAFSMVNQNLLSGMLS